MTVYCMEVGAERGEALVHEVSCGSLDLGTLMGNGDIYRLGEFTSSEQALAEAKKLHTNAVRCLDCCIPDFRSQELHEDSARSHKDKVKVNLYRGEARVGSSSRVRQQEAMPDRRPVTTASVVEIPQDRLKQFPVVFLA